MTSTIASSRLQLQQTLLSKNEEKEDEEEEEEENDNHKRLKVDEESTTRRRAVVETSVNKNLKKWRFSKTERDEIKRNLKTHLGIRKFFPWQAHALNRMLECPAQDVSICSPTGSGKTLVYAIAILHSLWNRVVRRLRALVVVPNRDLAEQVRSVFFSLAASRRREDEIRTVALTGEHHYAYEYAALVKRLELEGGARVQYIDNADILVSTPGRLLDHVNRSEGFTLAHLQWLVVDEADKLLAQSFYDWLGRVYAVRRRGGNTQGVTVLERLEEEEEPCMRRMLCSATLTRDPQKLAALALYRPLEMRYRGIDDEVWEEEEAEEEEESEGAFPLPTSLREEFITVREATKPATLVHLLESRSFARVLVFTSSVDRAVKLEKLLSTISKQQQQQQGTATPGLFKVSSLSSRNSSLERKSLLERFKRASGSATTTKVLVASDVAARGLDVENLDAVISYDPPPNATTYVHRAGRTARAGREGTSLVLLDRDADQRKRWNAVKRAQLGRPRGEPMGLEYVELDETVLSPYLERVEAAVAASLDLEESAASMASSSSPSGRGVGGGAGRHLGFSNKRGGGEG